MGRQRENEHTDQDIRVCLVLSTYNNAETLAEVIEGARRYVGDIIVVNDGCTDSTPEILSRLDGLDVVTHRKNLGKGQAIKSGFDRAVARGFTHVVTMDTDGQHDPGDLPKMLEAIGSHPDALILGRRELGDEPKARKSRMLRANSNFWVWVETGRRLGDTQTGFRAYPMVTFRDLHLKRKRYDFEVEAVVVAIWCDIPVTEVAVSVRYGTGSMSHFRPVRDFLWVTQLNIHFIWERLLLPKGVRQATHQKPFHDVPRGRRWLRLAHAFILQESVTPPTFAACIGVGVFFGILPVWGFQMAVAAVAAHQLGLSKPLTLVASNISIPLFLPFILYFSLLTGRLVLDGHIDFTLTPHGLTIESARVYLVEYLVGSVIFAFAASVAAGLGSFFLAHWFLSRRGAQA